MNFSKTFNAEALSANDPAIASAKAMVSPSRSPWLQLGFAGLLPFLGTLIGQALNQLWAGRAPAELFLIYSALILSFLSGGLWGTVLQGATFRRVTLLLASNALCLLGFAALIIQWQVASLVLLATAFAALLWLERRFVDPLSDPPGYRLVRAQLTGIVIMLHALMLIIVVW